jgi:hypothetical protein
MKYMSTTGTTGLLVVWSTTVLNKVTTNPFNACRSQSRALSTDPLDSWRMTAIVHNVQTTFSIFVHFRVLNILMDPFLERLESVLAALSARSPSCAIFLIGTVVLFILYQLSVLNKTKLSRTILYPNYEICPHITYK